MGTSTSPNLGSAFDGVTQTDNPISSYTDELARELDRYREQGQIEAAQHRPPSEARTLDKNESQLQVEAIKYLNVQRNFLDFELKKAVKAQSTLEQRLIQWRTKCEMALTQRGFLAAVDNELADDREKLILVTEKRMRSDVALRAFRARNGIALDESAKYPDSLYWHFGLVAVFGLIETLANAFFYQNDQGFLGGVIIAVSVSALNLGIAIGLGWASRYRNLQQRDKKIMGWLAMGAFVIWTLFSNALFAAFRGEYQSINPDNSAALAEAFRRSMTNAVGVFGLQLHLADFQSFILFGLGLLLSVLAFWKGLTSDDKYPGHSALDKVSASDRLAERQAQGEVTEKLKTFLRTKQTEMQSLLGELPLVIAEVVGRSGELSQAGAMYEARQQSIARDFEMVLTTYRQANVAIRATDAPSYFSIMPALPLTDAGPIFSRTMAGFDKVKQDAGAARHEFESRVQEKVHELVDESRKANSERLVAFRDSIAAEAQERINRDLKTLPQ